MTYQADDVWRMLLTQKAIVAGLMALLMIVSGLLGNILGAPISWLATVVGVVFWVYLGALALTAVRGALIKSR